MAQSAGLVSLTGLAWIAVSHGSELLDVAELNRRLARRFVRLVAELAALALDQQADFTALVLERRLARLVLDRRLIRLGSSPQTLPRYTTSVRSVRFDAWSGVE